MSLPKRIAVAGLARSGLAIARAAQQLGARPVVFDQKPGDDPHVIAAVDQLGGQGIEVQTGWHGRLDPAEFDLLVASPGFPRSHPSILDMLAGGREVWSEVEFAYRISRRPILAITGTNGKSTTTTLLWLLINGAGQRAPLCGNIAGSGYDEVTLTEAALSTLGSNPPDVLVAEVSSYQLEWVDRFRPRVATVTNVTPDHLDRHPSFDDYFRTKMRLLACMGQGDAAVFNASEPSVSADKVAPYVPAGLAVTRFVPESLFDGVTVNLGRAQVLRRDLPMLGQANLLNLFTAWAMATAWLGEPMDEVLEGMLAAAKGFRGLEHRMQAIGERDEVLVVDNSMCTNPAAVVASSRSLDRPQHLLMGGNTKNLDFGPVRDYLLNVEHRVYLFGPHPQSLSAMLGERWPVFKTLDDAFAAATAAARPGDAVLLAPGCASAAPYANFRERGEAFQAMAKEWLER